MKGVYQDFFVSEGCVLVNNARNGRLTKEERTVMDAGINAVRKGRLAIGKRTTQDMFCAHPLGNRKARRAHASIARKRQKKPTTEINQSPVLCNPHHSTQSYISTKW